MKITKVEIFPARDPERLKASAAVVFDDCFKVRDIFIFPRKDNCDELYVAMPVKKIKDDKRISLAHPINAEFRAEMEKAILDGKEFSDDFFSLVQRHGREEVWRDFITMSACAISNSVDKRFYDIREKMYMDTVKRYTKEEAEKMAEMFALVVMSLTEKPNQDFLGEAFSALGLHNEWKGQFFTPYHVGAFMAAVNIEPAVDQLKDKKLITVSDCCCGAGCLLIAFANEAMKAHIDFQSRVLFVAQDLDYVAGLMCYIQLSLLGCKAIVKIGNSLTDPFVNNDMETDSVWLSPMYTQEETFHMMRVLESIITLSDPEGDKEQDENTDAPTDKVSA